jgi:hypothetical protein
VKRKENRITFKSGANNTQTDYFIVRQSDKRCIVNYKVISNEEVVRPYKLLVMDFLLKADKPVHSRHEHEKIKI